MWTEQINTADWTYSRGGGVVTYTYALFQWWACQLFTNIFSFFLLSEFSVTSRWKITNKKAVNMSDVGRKKCNYFGAALLLFSFFSLSLILFFFSPIQKLLDFSAPSLGSRREACRRFRLLGSRLQLPVRSLLTPDGRLEEQTQRRNVGRENMRGSAFCFYFFVCWFLHELTCDGVIGPL